MIVFLSGTMQCLSVCAISILPGVSLVIISEWENTSSFQYHKMLQNKFAYISVKNKQKNNSEILTDWCTSPTRQQRVVAYFLSTQSCIPIAKQFDPIEVLYVHHHYASETIKDMVI